VPRTGVGRTGGGLRGHEVVGGSYQRRSRDAANDENFDLSTLVPGGFVPDQPGRATRVRAVADLIGVLVSI